MTEHHPDLAAYAVLDGQVIADVNAGRNQRLLYRDNAAVPVSLSMPLSRRRHPHTALRPWFAGLLPDRPELIMRWRRAFGVRDNDPLSLLPHVGEEVAGAARFVRPDRMDTVATGGVEPLTERDVARHLRWALLDIAPGEPSTRTGQFSLAGAQAKIALRRTDDGWAVPWGNQPTTHIIKPQIPGMPDQDLAEHLTMKAASRLGLPTAQTSLASFEDLHSLVVRRYDRQQMPSGEWTRLHQEDVLQALGEHPIRKYQNRGGPGPRQIGDLIRSSCGASADDDVRTFAAALVYNWLILGTDAHAKNYSLLIGRAGAARLAPLYDVNTHLPYRQGGHSSTLAMRIGAHYEVDRIDRNDWAMLAAELGIEEDWIIDEIDRQSTQIPGLLDSEWAELRAQRPTSTVPETLIQECASWIPSARRAVWLTPTRRGQGPARRIRHPGEH